VSLSPASIPSPHSNGFRLGPLDLHVYGLMYVVGILAAVYITRRRWSACGGHPDVVDRTALWGVPGGILGGRLYFDATTPHAIQAHWYGFLAVWDGGLGFWGGIAGGVAVSYWRLRREHVAMRPFMDCVAPALLVAQGIGRIGNYFNQELFGGPTTLPWGLKIALQFRPPGYAQDTTFQPTFLYELIFDFAWAALLVWLGHHRDITVPGLFALYVAGYSGFRIFEESLRVDYSEHFLGLRLNSFVAIALTVIGLVWFIVIQRRGPAGDDERARDRGEPIPLES
jgi:prolipoprotein diacylglyceryl transferase